MTLSKDTVNNIRAEIASVIESESDLFQAVYPWPKATLEGFPAVIVMPSENSSEYNSTSDRKMLFSFDLNVYYPTTNESGYEKTELAIGECVGDLLAIFCKRHPLTTCDWVTPVPSIWGETQVGEATYRTAKVILQCVMHVEIS